MVSGFTSRVGAATYTFATLADLLAKAGPSRSGDRLLGIAAQDASERVAASWCLADLPLVRFLEHDVVPVAGDEITELIADRHDQSAFQPVRSLTVGELRDWLLATQRTPADYQNLTPGLTPEMVAAVSKLMSNTDLVLVASRIHNEAAFRSTIGGPDSLSVRLQPNSPSDDPQEITISILDGLLHGCGDAVIGINPVNESTESVTGLLDLVDGVIQRYEIPTQSCVLAHVTTQLRAMERGAPVDLVFQSIAGTAAGNRAFGVDLALLTEAWQAARSLERGTVGNNVMYFETGQGSEASSNADHGVDQQTLEARSYAVAKAFDPLLVNSVVGFIGPEYLADGREITRAGLEDHFCGKLLGLPMGVDVCYTNHADADAHDLGSLLTQLGAAGVAFIMGVPAGDDVMLHYQTTSFNDANYAREVFGRRPAPEFDRWWQLNADALRDRSHGLYRSLGPAGPPRQIPASKASLPPSPPAERTPDPRPVAGAPPVAGVSWSELKALTSARVGLTEPGAALPTQDVLELHEDHARAQDAVRAQFDPDSLLATATALGLAGVPVTSRAESLSTYLERPDLGRRLSDASRSDLDQMGADRDEDGSPDVVVVVGDGLSSTGINRHGADLVAAVVEFLRDAGASVGPLVVAKHARVALGDEIGAVLGAKVVVMVVGERPGLSAADSVGAYLTYAPRVGRTDAERNCVSNIRPGGLAISDAGARIGAITMLALSQKRTGIELNVSDALETGDRSTLEAER